MSSRLVQVSSGYIWLYQIRSIYIRLGLVITGYFTLNRVMSQEDSLSQIRTG
jgi:hypothetical protein